MTLVSSAAIVIAVGNPAATSVEKDGPERTAIEQFWISSSITLWLNFCVSGSKPLHAMHILSTVNALKKFKLRRNA